MDRFKVASVMEANAALISEQRAEIRYAREIKALEALLEKLVNERRDTLAKIKEWEHYLDHAEQALKDAL